MLVLMYIHSFVQQVILSVCPAAGTARDVGTRRHRGQWGSAPASWHSPASEERGATVLGHDFNKPSTEKKHAGEQKRAWERVRGLSRGRNLGGGTRDIPPQQEGGVATAEGRWG